MNSPNPLPSAGSNANPNEPPLSYANPVTAQNIMGNPWLAMNPFQMLASQFQSNSPWPQQQFQNQPPISNGVPGPSDSTQQPQQPQHNLPLNPLAFLPAQLSNEVLRLSLPVGSSPDDESILIKALRECSKAGGNYRLAIEGLHGTNCHSSNLWKDFYLDNKLRIDTLVSDYIPSRTLKKPTLTSSSPTTVASESASRFRSSPPVPPKHNSRPKSQQFRSSASSSNHKRSRPSTSVKAARKTKRATINSITAYSPIQNFRNLTPPHADIRVPEPPSRSPTPPSRVVLGIRGNRYTEEDKKFFINFISYELKCNPSLTKNELAEMLHQKCPHHTAASWASWWSRHHDVPDKIFAAAHGEDDGCGESDCGSSDSGSYAGHDSDASDVRSELKSGDELGSESTCSGSSEDYDSDYAAGTASGSDDGGAGKQISKDVSNMGGEGQPFTTADLRVTAKYLASIANRHELTKGDIWKSFSQKHPQRSWKSWNEYYRRNEYEIEKLVATYRKQRKEARPSIQAQRGRPSWMSSKHRLPSEEDDEGHEDLHPSKRWRNDGF